MAIQPYLFFDGRTEEALEYYRQTLGAEIGMVMRFKDSPDGPPPGYEAPADKVMHSEMREADAKRRFDALAAGGQVQMPFGETFFAKAFGVVADRFGVSWMVMAGAKQ